MRRSTGKDRSRAGCGVHRSADDVAEGRRPDRSTNVAAVTTVLSGLGNFNAQAMRFT